MNSNRLQANANELTGIRKNRHVRLFLVAALFVIAVLVPPVVHNPIVIHDLIVAFVWAIAACGLRLLFVSGRFSVGQAGFLLIGGYTSGLLATTLKIDPWVGLMAAAATSAAVAFVLGLIVLRISGIYFMIITLCFGEIMRLLVEWWSSVTGGILGLQSIPGYSIAGFQFGISKTPYYYLILVIAFVALLFMYRMEHSRTGLTLRAMAQNDLLAAHSGIDLTRYRVIAFVTASAFTGLAGAFYAHYIHFISGAEFGFQASFNIQIFAIVGGLGFFAGPPLGAFFLTEVNRITRGLLPGSQGEVQPIVYGTLLVLTVMVFRGGLAYLPTRSRQWFSRLRRTQ